MSAFIEHYARAHNMTFERAKARIERVAQTRAMSPQFWAAIGANANGGDADDADTEPMPFTLREKDIETIMQWRRQANAVYDELDRRDAFDAPEPDHTFGGEPLTPGDLMFRTRSDNYGITKHFGVYIGRGLVIDVNAPEDMRPKGWRSLVGGVAPRSLSKLFYKNFIRLTTLAEWKVETPSNERTTFAIEHIPSRQRRARRDTVRMAINSLGPYDYKLTTSNCEHAARQMASYPFSCRQLPRVLKLWDLVQKPYRPDVTPTWTFSLQSGTFCKGRRSATKCPVYITMQCRDPWGNRQTNCYRVDDLVREIEKSEAMGHDYAGVCGPLSPEQVQRVKDAYKIARSCLGRRF